MDTTFIAAQSAPVKAPTDKATAIWANTNGTHIYAAVNRVAQNVTQGAE